MENGDPKITEPKKDPFSEVPSGSLSKNSKFTHQGYKSSPNFFIKKSIHSAFIKGMYNTYTLSSQTEGQTSSKRRTTLKSSQQKH